MKVRYKWFDLNDDLLKLSNPEIFKEIEPYGGPKNIPIVIINGHYIGGIYEL